jgi:hypothetical protein
MYSHMVAVQSYMGRAVAYMVEALRYKPEGRGLNYDDVTQFNSAHRVYSASNGNKYRYFLG